MTPHVCICPSHQVSGIGPLESSSRSAIGEDRALIYLGGRYYSAFRIFEQYVSTRYRVTHQVVFKLSIQGHYNNHIGPESRVWEQPDVSP